MKTLNFLAICAAALAFAACNVYEPGLLYKVDTVIPDEKWETRCFSLNN